jgi:hypothetical protein
MEDDGLARQVFRSPFAVVAWWVWVLFALANLIDLAVQGRDRLSLMAALGLLLITGVAYTVALRPRITAADGLLIINPLREHRIGWPAVAAVEAAELIRVRCEWPLPEPAPAEGTGKRVIYAWAVHSSRRRQAVQMRAQRRRAGIFGSGFAGAPVGGPGLRDGRGAASAGVGSTAGLNAQDVAADLATRAEAARTADASAAVPPLSTWHWPSVAVIVVPALALVIASLA